MTRPMKDQFNRPGETASLGFEVSHSDVISALNAKGEFFISLHDSVTGELLEERHLRCGMVSGD